MRVITPSLSTSFQSDKGDALDPGVHEAQIVPAGTMSRLKSIYVARNDLVAVASKTVILRFRDGISTSPIMFEILVSVVFNSTFSILNGTASDMVDFPDSGILFRDGMHIDVNYVDAADDSRFLITVIYTR